MGWPCLSGPPSQAVVAFDAMPGKVVELKSRGGAKQVPQLEVQDVMAGVLSEAVEAIQQSILQNWEHCCVQCSISDAINEGDVSGGQKNHIALSAYIVFASRHFRW